MTASSVDRRSAHRRESDTAASVRSPRDNGRPCMAMETDIARLVAESRELAGLPAVVTDEAALDRIARIATVTASEAKGVRHVAA